MTLDFLSAFLVSAAFVVPSLVIIGATAPRKRKPRTIHRPAGTCPLGCVHDSPSPEHGEG